MDNENNIRHHHKLSEEQNKDALFKIRNILNAIFMVVAIAGVVTYCTASHDKGIIVVLAAMVFKIAECCLRFFHK